MPNFFILTSPVNELTNKYKKFEMTQDAREAFDKIKAILTTAPILIHLNYNKPFIVQCDASPSGIGVVLCQADDDGVERPIYYFSHKLNKAQRNYSIAQLECLVAVSTIKKFKMVNESKGVIWTFGNLVTFIIRVQLHIEHRKGSDHIIPDALSRCLECVDELEMNIDLDVSALNLEYTVCVKMLLKMLKNCLI